MCYILWGLQQHWSDKAYMPFAICGSHGNSMWSSPIVAREGPQGLCVLAHVRSTAVQFSKLYSAQWVECGPPSGPQKVKTTAGQALHSSAHMGALVDFLWAKPSWGCPQEFISERK